MSKNRVKVFVRFRPTTNFAHESIELLNDGQTINIHTKKDERRKVVNNQIVDWSFKVDGILHNASQEQVHDTVVDEMVIKALDGFNGTLMAYGQTGAGKTFTITGATENYKHRGAIPRAIAQIFRCIEEQTSQSITVRISYLEIYNETMFDLLSTLPESSTLGGYENQMAVVDNADGSVYVKGLSLHIANNEGEALNYLFEGETNRAIASHSLNKNSSRSHCIFTVHLESKSRTISHSKYVTSKLNLVDLAGSERLGKTGSEGQIQREAMYINKSLTFLEQTVIALAEKNRGHIPYRQTKLTHALKDSIGGKCCTTMIANVYGDSAQLEETTSTLRFAMRMMCVPVEATMNEHYDPWLLVRELDSEIKRLKQELDMHSTLANRVHINYGPMTEGQVAEIKKQVRAFLEGKTTELDVSNLNEISAIFNQFRTTLLDMEQEMNRQFKNKFVLVDKADSDVMLALQKAGVPLDDESNYTGVSEMLLTGPAITMPTTAAPAGKQKAGATSPKHRKNSSKKRGVGSPTGRGAQASPAQPANYEASLKTAKSGAIHVPTSVNAESIDSAKKDGSVPSDVCPEDKKASRPSTPPLRDQSFEEFKKEQGQEIYRILCENKSILISKKRIVRDLAHAVNATKHMIDGTRLALERKKNERMEQGEFVNEEGETVIDEEEFQVITQLKNLKQQYRHDYDELRFVKGEVNYCQKLVDQCRQRLVQEFDAWYNESFLQGGQETSAAAGYGTRPGVVAPARLMLSAQESNLEDDQERFERVQQELLMEHQDSAAFYNAKLRTRRRQTYDRAMAQQPQPSKKVLPGVPHVSVKNKPPNRLSVAY